MNRATFGVVLLASAACLITPSAFAAKKKASDFEKVLHEVEELPEFRAGSDQENPRLRSLRALVAEMKPTGKPAKNRFKSQSLSGPKATGEEVHTILPDQVAYRFGSRVLARLDEQNNDLKKRLKKGSVPSADDLSPASRLRWLAEGCLPEAELILASIQQRLDVQVAGDELALFLDAWRNYGPNGDESFYEALDRTAGTPDEVFFYDAMLGAFCSKFAGKRGIRWSLQRQHEYMQQAFLTYRQYRGLIEAVSFSLVLTPDLALPQRLSRYDYSSVPAGRLSLRHQIDLLVEARDNDAVSVINLVEAFLKANPMPDPIWEKYDPLTEFYLVLRGEVSRLVEREVLSTEELLEAQQKRRVEFAAQIREACQAVVAG